MKKSTSPAPVSLPVFATLWGRSGEVSDEYCVGVARVLYETMRDEGMTDVAVCRGLHRAIRALRDKDMAMTQTKESYTAGNIKVSGADASGGEGAIQQENDDQSDAKTGSIRGILSADDDAISTLEGKEGRWVRQEETEIVHGETITCTNRNDTVTVDTSREGWGCEDKLGGGGDKPRNSSWDAPGDLSQLLGGPLI
ncbi:hypothetical protein CC80DRAFT_6121 [Byssothecium circinans]|uniref:Uncharacterized protein n=1 Tax=Byssothecium circinans TaxID=147558 RepID=A0A6A5UFD8_9PLEO|nr:hypothetical protein CC80DRAFT_6121 [Byssothecium circinans]